MGAVAAAAAAAAAAAVVAETAHHAGDRGRRDGVLEWTNNSIKLTTHR